MFEIGNVPEVSREFISQKVRKFKAYIIEWAGENLKLTYTSRPN